MSKFCLQYLHSPQGRCFGCGPANPDGLQLQSFAGDGEVVALWNPSDRYQAFPGILNGGITGTLLDCHANWTAAWHLMSLRRASQPPCTVTSEYTVKLLRPIPLDHELQLTAKPVEWSGERVVVDAMLTADGKPRATLRGVFVAVRPGHPAYHQW